jgi:predicted amidophosphoribosyltransferase
VLAALLDLVLPQPCAGCGGHGSWCAGCADVLAAAARRPLGSTRPDPTPAGFPAAAAAAAYDGAVRGALLAHKERGRLSLTAPLGRALAAAVACLDLPRDVVLVPVPSSRQAVRERGHDHALRLARHAARVLTEAGQPACARSVLVPTRALGDSAGLGAAGRSANLAGAFRAAAPVPPGLAVVVVDDVMTTGASLVEATRALTVAGARVHGAATVAATVRRYGRGYRRTPVH